MISSSRAYSAIRYVESYFQNALGVTAKHEDLWIAGAGMFNVTTHTIQFSTAGIVSIWKDNGDAYIDDDVLFGSLVTLGHEYYHYKTELHMSDLSFNDKLFYFISDNLSVYYNRNKLSHLSYYNNDLHEICAEWNGICFANESLHVFGFSVPEIDAMRSAYISELLSTGHYYIDNCVNYDVQSLETAFKSKQKSVLTYNFPFPDCESVCCQIVDDYGTVDAGINQLAMMAACVFKVRNYQQEDFVS